MTEEISQLQYQETATQCATTKRLELMSSNTPALVAHKCISIVLHAVEMKTKTKEDSWMSK